MTLRPIAVSTAPAAAGPYSQAIEYGNLLFCSGQIPIDPLTGKMVEGGIQEQAEQVLKNLANLLAGGGSDMNHVLKATVFLADLAHFQEMNAVYAKHFGNHKPARSTIQVAALPLGSLIEIEVIAAVARTAG
jgi:2-iminobutanoate/2-iminopropanoate deaminase